MRIEPVVDIATLERGSELFDDPPLPAASSQLLERQGHYLLFAWGGTDRPVGFISGVEVAHPDKGTQMYVNELAVAEAARHRGVAAGLLQALAALAKEAGCYGGVWEVCDPDNVGALATYRWAGPSRKPPQSCSPGSSEARPGGQSKGQRVTVNARVLGREPAEASSRRPAEPGGRAAVRVWPTTAVAMSGRTTSRVRALPPSCAAVGRLRQGSDRKVDLLGHLYTGLDHLDPAA